MTDYELSLEQGIASFNALINYMLGKGANQEPLVLLHYWNQGDFDSCREGWPDAPEEIYIGSDPLHPETLN